jgi:hypothetical protein
VDRDDWYTHNDGSTLLTRVTMMGTRTALTFNMQLCRYARDV